MQLLIVIAGLPQRVDRIRTGCDGRNNSEGASFHCKGLRLSFLQKVLKAAQPTFEEKFGMSHTVRFTEGTVEERVGALEKYLTELQLHRDSRRGLEGARGLQGERGEVGPVGPATDV